MRIRAGYLGTAFALFMFAVPVWAHTDTVQFTAVSSTEIGTTELKPGNYRFEVAVNGEKVKVVDQDSGKTVAEVPCHWVTLDKKPYSTEVVVTKGQVTEIDFHGQIRAVRVG
ncbi:MAG TPA: hypothetical protein VEJ67_18595 [Candidatus Cybelea sp.]|nr:hypothetical protein [Candidatus Cybelea sp.]